MKKILIALLFIWIGFLIGCSNKTTNDNELIITGPSKVELGKVIKLDTNSDKELLWTSDNPTVASVEDGYVYGNSIGKTIIRCYRFDKPEITDGILISVVENTGIDDETIIISGPREVERGKTITLTTDLDTDIRWYTSNAEVATVNDGVITGLSLGTVIIKAEDKNNRLNYGSYKIEVIEQRIIISGPKEVIMGESINLTKDTNANVTWTVDYTDLAMIDDKGFLTSIRTGKVLVTVTNVVNSLNYGTYEVTILPPLDIEDNEYEYYQTKILAIDEAGYHMELLNVPYTAVSSKAEYLKYNRDQNQVEKITIKDLYLGLENVYVAVGKQSHMIKKVLLDGDIGFRNIRVAIRKSINDIADNSTLYHNLVNFSIYSPFVIQTFDGAERFTFYSDSNINIYANNGLMNIIVNGINILETDKRVLILPEGAIVFASIYRAQGIPIYEGNMEVSMVNGRLLVVNDIDIEKYLTKVVPSEMPASWQLEALKAQAVAARTCAYMGTLNKSYDRYGYTLDDSTMSQVYNNSNPVDKSTQAINETKGMIMTYNGVPVETFYYSASCGLTASANEVWITDEVTEPVPYLIGQNLTADSLGNLINFDPTSETSMLNFFKQITMSTPDTSSPYHRWRVTMTYKQLSQTIKTNLKITYASTPESVLTKVGTGWESKKLPSSIGDVTDIYVSERGSSGVVVSLVIVTTTGTYKIINQYNIRFTIRPKDAGSNVYRYYATNIDTNYVGVNRNDSILPSGFFAIEHEGGNVHFYGGGNGHGVGMSQYGANGLAGKGATYDYILSTYYQNIDFTDITYQPQDLENYQDLLKGN